MALVVIALGAIALVATLFQGRTPAGRVSNGWIAIAATPTSRWEPANGIYLVGAGIPAHRIIGSDGDRIRRGCPRFSPDGTKLAYGEGRDLGVLASDRSVVVVNIDSEGAVAGAPVRIPVDDAGPITCSSWSADGRSLAFLSDEGAVEIHDVDGGVLVIPDRGHAEIRDLQWSPVERTLAVAGANGLWVLPVNGQPVLVRGGKFDTVRWSGDGQRLAATELPAEDGLKQAPGRAVISGATVRLVWRDGRDRDVELRDATAPSWSAQGDLVVLAREMVDGELRPVNKVIRSDGSELLPDTSDGQSTSGALWSPDGAWLLHTIWSVDDQMEMAVVTPVAGGKPVLLAPVPGRGFWDDRSFDELAWQPVHE